MGAHESFTTTGDVGHWIAGQRDSGASGRAQAVNNPATGAVARQVHLGGEREVAAAVAAADEDSQRGAADLATPTRRTVLSDPAIQAKFRWYPAIAKCLDVGEPPPALAEFSEVAEVACKRIVQAIVGQMPVKAALDAGAAEVVELLTRRGYYKG